MQIKRFFFQALSITLLLSVCGSALTPQPADARKKFDKATVDPAIENFDQGMKLVRERNYEGAIDSFLQAVYFSRNHYNPNAYKMLGLCYKATRNYPKAIQAFLDHLSQVTEPAADARIDLAECYIELGEFEKAREQINFSFRDQPFSQGTWRQRYAQGELAERMGDLGDAIGFYDSAIDEKKLYTEAHMGKARCYVKLNRFVEALQIYRTVLEKNMVMKNIPWEELYYEMGTCLYKRGDHQGALDHWRLALEQNPDSFDAHLALASMLDEEKHISSAIKEYQAALRTMPKSTPPANKTKIEKRLLWLEQKLTPRDASPEIKPTPTMRREFDEATRERERQQQAPAPHGDPGF